jgi:preprotein translocase subunit Sec63
LSFSFSFFLFLSSSPQRKEEKKGKEKEKERRRKERKKKRKSIMAEFEIIFSIVEIFWGSCMYNTFQHYMYNYILMYVIAKICFKM